MNKQNSQILFFIVFILLLFNTVQNKQKRNLSSLANDNLIAYYPFHNSAEDVYGNNDGIAYSVTGTTNRHGQQNKAYKFFDATTRVVFPESILNGLRTFSFVLWMKSDNPQGSQNLDFFSGTKTGTNDILITLSQFLFNGNSIQLTQLRSNMVANKWHHIAVTFSNTYISFFLDGKIIEQREKEAWIGDIGVGGFLIGQDQDSLGGGFEANSAFHGSISDVRFYNTRITPNIIQQLYLEEKDQCQYGCSSCDSNNLCTNCKGNRILIEGECLCPPQYYESYTTNCLSENSIYSNSLIAHFPLNTFNATDIINNKDATVYGCSQQPDRFGNQLSAYRIENTSTWLNLEAGSIVNGRKTLSVSIWVKKRAPSDRLFTILHFSTTGNNEMCLYGTIVCFNDNEAYTLKTLSLKDYLVVDQWVQIIYVIDVTTYQIYLNGAIVEQGNKPDFTLGVANRGIVVGQDQDDINGGFDPNDTFSGDVSDIKIYSKALSEEEARLQYQISEHKCSFGCKGCKQFSRYCAQCKGNRILYEGNCLCPQGTYEDDVSENCPLLNTLQETGQIAYYPFQNNGTDVYGGNDGVVNNLVPTQNRLGQPNSAFTFQGTTSSYFKLPGSAFNGFITYTFSFWTTHRGNSQTDKGPRFWLTAGVSGSLNNIHFSNMHSQMYNSQTIYYNGLQTLLRTTYYNQWVYIVKTITNDSVNIYLNGKLFQSFSVATKIMDIHEDGFAVGQDQDSLGGAYDANQAWKGEISDLRIYNIAQTDEQIKHQYNVSLNPCYFPCSYCMLQSMDCALCRGDRIKNEGKCNCPVGKFEDLQSTNCPNCSYKCASCELNQNNCLTCKDDQNRISTPDCNCKDHYFDDGTSVCKICSYKCSTCIDNTDKCTGCQGTNRSSVYPACECNSGYYDDGSNQDCVQCNYKYSTCENLTGNALECSDSNRAKDNDIVCDCNQGWFDQGSQNKVCGQCHPKCLNCSGSSNNCGTCKGLQRNTSTCVCAHGYFDDDTNSDCQQCDPQCDGCIGSSDNCIECKDTQKDKNAINKCTICLGDKTLDSDNNCVCAVTGEYELLDNDNCQICNYKCETCIDNAENCQTCSDSNRQKSNDTICDCDQGWYDQGNQNKVCGKCHPRCLDCSDTSDNCGTCKGLQRNSQTCQCEDSFFDNNLDSDCQKCNYVCDTCQTSNINCLTCSDSNRSKLNSPICSCDQGWYDQENNNPICLKCDYKCLACKTNSNNCLQCNGTNRKNNFPDCDCELKYFDNGETNCMECDSKCATCENNAQNCLTCIEGERIIEEGCKCKQGYYGDCTTKCDNNCQECEDRSDNCTKCTGRFRNNQDVPNCGCLPTYYDNSVDLDCQPCQVNNCLKCDQADPTICLITESQFYWNEQLHKVLPCDERCDECTQNGCITCRDIQFRSQPFCHCLQGYYESQTDKKCQQCQMQCKICTNSSDQCLVCKQGKYRNLIKPICGCIDGYYQENNNIDCQECNSACKKCNVKDICIECNNSEFEPPLCQNSNKSFTVIVEENSNQIITKQCSIQCESCIDQINNCTKCKLGLYRTQLLPNCNCLDGYHDFDGTTNDCFKCKNTCKTCLDPLKCQSCQMNQNRILNPVTLQCDCIQGYVEDSKTFVCKKCYIFKGVCFQQCPKNTIEDQKLNQCRAIEYQKLSNSQLIYLCSGILLGVYFILCMLSKKCIKRQLKKLYNTSKNYQNDKINFIQIKQQSNDKSNKKYLSSDSDNKV